MTTTIDYDRAVELLREVVAERGEDFVYTPPPFTIETLHGERIEEVACAYAEEKDGVLVGSCGVGVALAKLDPDVLAAVHRFDPGPDRLTGLSAKTVIRDVVLEKGYDFTPEAVSVMVTFQYLQDRGRVYGRCLEAAAGLEDVIPSWEQ